MTMPPSTIKVCPGAIIRLAASCIPISTPRAIHVHRLVPIVFGDFEKGSNLGNPRIVDDYAGELRAERLARAPLRALARRAVGPVFARLEPRPIMRAVLHGGFVDKTKLPEDFLAELLRSGRRQGYSKVARAIYRSLAGLNRAATSPRWSALTT
jgi:hypothetical protein